MNIFDETLHIWQGENPQTSNENENRCIHPPSPTDEQGKSSENFLSPHHSFAQLSLSCQLKEILFLIWHLLRSGEEEEENFVL